MTTTPAYTWDITHHATTQAPNKPTPQHNQDAHNHWTHNGKGIIITTDGAGSHTHSKQGAQLTAGTITEHIKDNLQNHQTLPTPQQEAQYLQTLLLEATQHAINTTHLTKHNTQMGCTIAATTYNNGTYATLTLGDAFTITGDNQNTPPQYQSHTEDWQHPNITTFTTSPHPTIITHTGTNATWHIVSTDGLKNVFTNTPTRDTTETLHTPLFTTPDKNGTLFHQKLLNNEHACQALLAALADQNKLTDDTTIVIAGNSNPPTEEPLTIISPPTFATIERDENGIITAIHPK